MNIGCWLVMIHSVLVEPATVVAEGVIMQASGGIVPFSFDREIQAS
jgi:hypothetical protein